MTNFIIFKHPSSYGQEISIPLLIQKKTGISCIHNYSSHNLEAKMGESNYAFKCNNSSINLTASKYRGIHPTLQKFPFDTPNPHSNCIILKPPQPLLIRYALDWNNELINYKSQPKENAPRTTEDKRKEKIEYHVQPES